MYEYKLLKIDKEKCTNCNVCEVLLPGFKTDYNGEFKISKEFYETEQVQVAVQDVLDACFSKAVNLYTIQYEPHE